MIQQQRDRNNNSRIRDRKPFNDFLATNIDATLNDRYCTRCHLKLVHNPRNSPYDRYIYSCPQCNCTSNIHQTEPGEKLVATFPTHNAVSSMNNSSNRKQSITQPENQRLSRSQYFIHKNLKKKSEIEDQDPYLAILKKNNKITITNVDYYDATEYDE